MIFPKVGLIKDTTTLATVKATEAIVNQKMSNGKKDPRTRIAVLSSRRFVVIDWSLKTTRCPVPSPASQLFENCGKVTWTSVPSAP